MWLDHLRQDTRYALRSSARSPLFALTAVLSIAIGIGADVAVFTVANALLLREPAGVADSDRLVDISATGDDRFGINEISFPNYTDLRERATTLRDICGYEPTAQPMSLVGREGAERVFGHLVTPNYFSVLGVGAAAGRVFDSTAPASETDAVVISHAFWTRRFNNDLSIVGTTVVLNNKPATIIGVAAEGFEGTSLIASDLWAPLARIPFEGSFLTRRDLGWALLRGRLQPGVSVAQAAAEVQTIGLALAREYPEQNAGRGFRLARASMIPGNLALPLAGIFTALLGFVSLVLAIACANLAGLLLARGVTRRREIAVRVAVGAGRGRLISQLFTEVTLLFLAGGATGLLLAHALTALVATLLPALPVPLGVSLALDGRVVAFTAAISFAAALVCGLVPSLQASKSDVVSALKDDEQGVSRRSRLRNAFVVSQVACSVVLVAWAGVFVRALQKSTSVDPGFDLRGVELATIDLSLAGYTPSTGPAFARQLLERVRALPQVESATIAAVLPTFGGAVRFGILTHPGMRPERGGQALHAAWNAVEPGYFRTMRIPIVRGRDFSALDTASAPRVAIVSEEAARRFWPGQDPIGKFLLLHPSAFRRDERNEARELVVIGISRDVKALTRDAARAQVYVPLQQQFVPGVTIAARTHDGRRVAGEIREVIAIMNRNLPIISSETLEDAAMVALLPQRVAAAVSGSLGVVGLLLAAMGIYGVTAFVVAQRTREIGIRVALGAQREQIVRFVLRSGLALMALGCIIGVTLATLAHVALTRVFFGFPALDPIAFGAAVGIFGAIGLGACYPPIRRATRVDPVTALRSE